MVIQIKNDCEKIIHIEKVQNFQFIHFFCLKCLEASVIMINFATNIITWKTKNLKTKCF